MSHGRSPRSNEELQQWARPTECRLGFLKCVGDSAVQAVGEWPYIDLRPLPQLPAGAVHAVDATGRRGGSQCRAGRLNYRPLKPGGAVLTAVAYTCFQGVGLIEISNHGH